MKATIDVESRQEAETLRTGLSDPSVRAFVAIVGVLMPLTQRARQRTMTYVADKLAEDAEIASASAQQELNLAVNGGSKS
jgi:hypothetical protein